jgi:DNA polymerase-3 subunit beta
MKFSISRKSLLQGLDCIRTTAAKKSTIPILNGVCLKAEGSGVCFSATDCTVFIRTQIAATVALEGSVVVNARDLYDIAKVLPDGPVTFEVSEHLVLEVTCGRISHKLQGHSSEDFPVFPERVDAGCVKIDVGMVKELIDCTQYAISNGNWNSPGTCGASFECDGGTLRMIATDGLRLSKAEIKMDGVVSDFKMLVPSKGIQELLGLVEGVQVSRKKGDHRGAARWQPLVVEVSQERGTAFFYSSGIQLSVRLIEATFPSYEYVIPKKDEIVVLASRIVLLEALKRISHGKWGSVRLEFLPGKWNRDSSEYLSGSLKIFSADPNVGERSEEVTVDYTGDPITIGFEAMYLLDVLGALHSDEISLGFSVTKGTSNTINLMTIRPVQEYSYIDFVGLVMSLRAKPDGTF